jgi:hypothetical protein
MTTTSEQHNINILTQMTAQPLPLESLVKLSEELIPDSRLGVNKSWLIDTHDYYLTRPYSGSHEFDIKLGISDIENKLNNILDNMTYNYKDMITYLDNVYTI